MGELRTAGHKGWWHLKQFMGKGIDGTKQTRECFRNMVTGEVHAPENGWSGSPPAPTGDILPLSNSELYVQNFDLIKWEGGGKNETEETEVLTEDVQEKARADSVYRKNYDGIKWSER